MSTVFIRDPAAGWEPERLAEGPVTLEVRETGLALASGARTHGCRLIRWGGAADWAVLVPRGVRLTVNETPVASGLRLLRHRDALRLDARPPVYFSTEEAARVETFAGRAEPVYCPRCRGEVVRGEAAVRCPACGLLHHQGDQRPCWTYAATCAGCSQPTDLDTGLQWTPEDL